jgi:hypothetical protein
MIRRGVGSEWSASRPCHFTLEEKAPCTHLIGGWVDPRDRLDDMEKIKFLTLPGLELRSLGRTARSQSSYRLRYRGFTRSPSSIFELSEKSFAHF